MVVRPVRQCERPGRVAEPVSEFIGAATRLRSAYECVIDVSVNVEVEGRDGQATSRVRFVGGKGDRKEM